jgi:hypothetical protein
VRVLPAVAVLLAACAAPRTKSVEPAPVAASPSPPPPSPTPPSPPPQSVSHVARLAWRFRDEGVRLAGWPVRDELPRPERCYEAAFLWADLACDGWSYDLLVDVDNPRVLWVRRTGTIVGGIVSYLGPAEIVDDAGPLVLRVGER